jgi:stress response protein YsnF
MDAGMTVALSSCRYQILPYKKYRHHGGPGKSPRVTLSLAGLATGNLMSLSNPTNITESNQADIVLPVHKEEVTISRRVVAGDVVRISTVTEQREHLVDEPVFHERVEIEHVAIGREVDAVPDIVEDGDLTIIPVVEEIVVVQRRLMLKEELHVRRVRETSQHHEVVLLREQKAVVTRTPNQALGQENPAQSPLNNES